MEMKKGLLWLKIFLKCLNLNTNSPNLKKKIQKNVRIPQMYPIAISDGSIFDGKLKMLAKNIYSLILGITIKIMKTNYHPTKFQ